ncbi:lipopolysaccharide/colanic/teichoic acid biosynthesis glycosyltransferase [Paraburkholderia bannensis]|uniref:Lipopolysaccharide/colanic/teichoic acid biosynthesis glycosyltransferase n=1 Tax=Paraburkholderia bannensis TaxID=765414 RepID=A0A7W9WT50_9BURK|nr:MULTISPECIES: sugar transferase [Paraburkholderia]MBB3257974.1 lipopolysaccharide/colanic/teichoic acid biosynthesis glycosyltransferase [Paraburkholderia sp. WP4_3_2]MBB6102987.1 lipopolysaccharide/colanic/teichoic acid biosynthesis glycosyltransferase [Paraburkholderia bannensis]
MSDLTQGFQEAPRAPLTQRAVDVVLIVLGAICAVHLNLNFSLFGAAHHPDPTLVAFCAALALSVFPACGTYGSRGSRSIFSVAGRTALAWLAVQLCGLVLLYAIHRDHLLQLPWFLYWTLTTGISLMASHTLFLSEFSVLRLTHAWWRRKTFDVESRSAVRPAVIGHMFKRMFDIVAAVAALVLFLPLFVALAVMVKRDGGPVFFGHMRVGRHGKKFRCFKFRSMVVNSEQVLKDLLARDPLARAEWEREFKLKNDVRVTTIGRFLRRSSLDELPQIWNVLRGEMSFVGPRPIIDEELERYGEASRFYLMATPGITGLWQVSGRNDIDYATRVSLDVSYVENWTFSKDIGILFKTVLVVIRGKGAY